MNRSKPTINMSKEAEEIIQFIGERVIYDELGGYIFGVDDNGNNYQMIAEVRGWGAIQNLFKKKVGELDKAQDFQDHLGKFIADAVTEKLALSTYKSSLIERLEERVAYLEDRYGDRGAKAKVDELKETLKIIEELTKE